MQSSDFYDCFTAYFYDYSALRWEEIFLNTLFYTYLITWSNPWKRQKEIFIYLFILW